MILGHLSSDRQVSLLDASLFAPQHSYFPRYMLSIPCTPSKNIHRNYISAYFRPPLYGLFWLCRIQDRKQGFETFGVTKTRAGLRPIKCSIIWLLEVISQRVKRPEPETDQWLPFVPRLKNDWSYTVTTTYYYMTWGLEENWLWQHSTYKDSLSSDR